MALRLAFPLALIAGCALSEAQAPDTCGAQSWQRFLGKTEAEFRAAGPKPPFRVVCHDCMVTMDYNPKRLNVKLDKAGRIAEITCG